MNLRKLGFVATTGLVMSSSLLAMASPAEAWCRFGGCGWGWRGPSPVAAGVVAGAIVGGAVVAAAAGPRPYPPPGGRYVCPPGYHWGPQGRACWAD